ncbi:MAG: MinD/ParA family ATP-binding protein [Sporichthyaceae bacterium]
MRPSTAAAATAPMAPAPAPVNIVAPAVRVLAPTPSAVERPAAATAVPSGSVGIRRRGRFGPARMRRAAGPAVELPAPGADLVRVEDMRRPFRRPMTVLVANPKGGSGKTPLTLMLAGTLALMRGGHVLAWDNNEARGGLAQRSDSRGDRTVRDLLADLEAFESHRAGMGELAGYLRPQDDLFDVLAADDDPASLAQIATEDFARLHAVLRRYYRILVLDSGNNVRSEAWQAAAAAADCLVLATGYDADGLASADWTLRHLEAIGRADLVERAVTVLTAATARVEAPIRADALARFARTAAIVEVAHDPKLRAGERIARSVVSEATVAAMVAAAHAVVDQLAIVDERPADLPDSGSTSSAYDDCPTAEIQRFGHWAVQAAPAAERTAATAAEAAPAAPVCAPDELELASEPALAEPAPKAPRSRRPAPAATASTKAASTKAASRKGPSATAASTETASTETCSSAPQTPAKPKRTRRPAQSVAARPATVEPAVSEALLDEAAALLEEAAAFMAGVESQAFTGQVTHPQATPEVVVAPRTSKEPTSTRRIAKPRTDAPVPAHPPAADAPAPAGAAASGEVVSIAAPTPFAPTGTAGLPEPVEGRRS